MNMKRVLFRYLDAYVVIMLLRAATVATILLLEDEIDMQSHIWFYPIQMLLYQLLIIILLAVLFKLKKVEIMLNLTN